MSSRHSQHWAPGRWTFRDLVLAGRSKGRLEVILGSSPRTEHLLEEFHPEKTFQSVKSTLTTNLDRYRIIAAAWHRATEAGRSFTVGDWLSDGSTNHGRILVLGNNPNAKEAISRVNRLLFTVVSKAILSRPGYASSRHFLFLDEFRELGHLDNIADLMITGRSKGASVTLGFQGIEGVDEVYGKNMAREIVGCAQNFAFLHMNYSQSETQQWAATVVGEAREDETHRTDQTSFGMQGSTHSVSKQTRERDFRRMLPSQFARDIAPPTSDRITALFRLPCKADESGDDVFLTDLPGDRLFRGDQTHPLRIPDSCQYFPDEELETSDAAFELKDWTESDFDRLAIPGLRRSNPDQAHGAGGSISERMG